MEPKFIIECYSEDYFQGNPFYLRKIGPKPWNMEFTDDPYKAKVLDKEQTAEKTAERIHKYIKHCYDAGYSTYGYSYANGKVSGILEDVDTKVRKIKISFIDE